MNIVDSGAMREVSLEVYEADCGHTMRREEGKTPNGNSIAGRWVLRDAAGAWVDFDKYRYDLMERHGFRQAPRKEAAQAGQD